MRVFLTIFILLVSLSANATHWLTYYVYYETEYIQGPWSRFDILETSEYKYLDVLKYEDLFGSDATDLTNKMLSRLWEKNNTVYDWDYDLILQGDSVIIVPKEEIKEFETVKNEIVATFTSNGYKTVIFRFTDQEKAFTINDLSLPYFDLTTRQKENEKAITTTTSTDITENTQPNENHGNENILLIVGLIVSCIINIGFIVFLIMKKKK